HKGRKGRGYGKPEDPSHSIARPATLTPRKLSVGPRFALNAGKSASGTRPLYQRSQRPQGGRHRSPSGARSPAAGPSDARGHTRRPRLEIAVRVGVDVVGEARGERHD